MDGEIDGSAYPALAGRMEALSDLSDKTRDKFHRIAGPETVATLWYYLRAQRCSPANEQRRATLKTTCPFDTSIKEQLSRYQRQYKNMETPNEHFTELPRRLYFAKIAGLYIKETLARRQTKPQRKRRRIKKDSDGEATGKSLNNIFVDLLVPQLQLEGETRKHAKKRFENWRQIGRACIKLAESFGIGILLLIPQDLCDEK
jgi:hypothetical protein